jgi:hypothetical protein
MTKGKYPSAAEAVKRLPQKPGKITPPPTAKYDSTKVNNSMAAVIVNASRTKKPQNTLNNRRKSLPRDPRGNRFYCLRRHAASAGCLLARID